MAERWFAVLLLGVVAGAWGQGAIDAYEFDDALQEARYKDLIAEFRCPKCLNTNLAGSDAPIARDLRRAVHGLVLEGLDDQAIRAHLQARYGDFVLYNPPVRTDTMLLWLVPIGLLIAAAFAIARMARRKAVAPLDADDLARVERLLDERVGSEPPLGSRSASGPRSAMGPRSDP
jgi:cytochrome c-type biogenesis protein CcmH